MGENTKETRRLSNAQEAPSVSPEVPDKPKLKAKKPRRLTCWKCEQEHHENAVFLSTEDHFRFRDGRKLCPEHKAAYLARLREQKELSAKHEEARIAQAKAEMDRPMPKKRFDPPMLQTGDLFGPKLDPRF